jgi:glutamate/tyrosine decarboxylase-like PLP-dependent enzyme
MPNESRSRIELTPDQMRELGYRVVDMIVEHRRALADMPVTRKRSRAELEALLREPAPADGSDPIDVLERARREIFGEMSHVDHPRFFAYVPGPGNFIGAMADALVAGLNPFAGAWGVAAGPAQVELVAIDWLRQFCGLPADAGGLFVSGGSMANLTALAVARGKVLGGKMDGAAIFCSDQTHSSIDRGARVLGFSESALRKLPSDSAYRLDVGALRDAIRTEREAGGRPFCIVANAGTTNTGAIDPLRELAAIAREEGMWLHVDGAYGAAATLSARGRALLDGIGEADSISLDPHKWLFQPFECGCVIIRDGDLLRDAFRIVPEYLKDTDRGSEEVNFRDWGVQLTRSLRALKLWMSIQTFGTDAFAEAIEWGMSLAEQAEERLRRDEVWEIITPAQMAIVTFRARRDGMEERRIDELNREVASAMGSDGYALLSTTALDGRTVLRLCTINPRTTAEDIVETISRLERMAHSLLEPAS